MASALAQGRDLIHGFFGWWLGELAGMVPKRLRAAASGERPRLVLVVEADRARLLSTAGGGEQLLGEAPLDGEDPALRLGAALRQAGRSRRAVVRLGRGLGLRKSLDLPLAAQTDLNQALRFDMDRITPFRADEVLFAWRVLRVDQERRRLQVELQLAPGQRADQALELATGLGLQPQRLELDEGEHGGSRLDLMPRASGRAGASRLNRLLLLLVAALALAAVLIPLHEQRQRAAALEAEVAAARGAAEKSMQLRQTLETLSAAGNFVVRQKVASPMVAEIVAELSRVIPDQAHVVQLDLHDGGLQLHGFADQASDLIALLDESPLFHAPQFRSPVVRDPRTDKERFQIALQLAGEGS